MDRIKNDFDALCMRIGTYQENIANPDQHKDNCEAAYEGLYKLMQRIKKELISGDLNKNEKSVCCEIQDDNFLNGLIEFRTIAAHIQSDTAKKRGHFQLYVPSGQSVEFDCEVSAVAAFSEKIFKLPMPSCGIETIDHLDNLRTAKERILKKIDRNYGF